MTETSAFHVEGQSIVRGSMGFQWINGLYLDCEHRLSETAFWNLLIMELVFGILLIMCISCELLIKQADIISLYSWELMIGATAFVIIWAFDCLNFWIQLCRECEETRYALCGLEVNMKLIGSIISIKWGTCKDQLYGFEPKMSKISMKMKFTEESYQ